MSKQTYRPHGGLINRSALIEPATFNDAEGTVEVVWSSGAAVMRRDAYTGAAYEEVLDMSPECVDLSRFDSGSVQVLDGHDIHGGVRAILGIAERGWIQDGQGRALLRLSRRPELAGIVADIRAGIIRAVSFGYSVQEYEITYPDADNAPDERSGGGGGIMRAALSEEDIEEDVEEDSLISGEDIEEDIREDIEEDSLISEEDIEKEEEETRRDARRALQRRYAPRRPVVQRSGAADAPLARWRAVRWMPQEISFVAVPADAQAGTRGHSAGALPAAATTRVNNPPTAAMPTRATTPTTPTTTAADIVELCQRHGLPELAAPLLRSGATTQVARAAILDRLAALAAPANAGSAVSVRTGAGGISTVRDEHETRMRGMEQALWHRLQPGGKLPEAARQWHGASLPDMARDCLQGLGVNTRGMGRSEVITTALRTRAGGLHTTGDFPGLLGGVGGRRLRQSYEQSPATYHLWARRAANLPDFRITNVMAVGGAPELKKLGEGGEYTYGTVSEDAVGYRAFSYGRAIGITRHMLVNDDLGAFDRLAERFGEAARRLENKLVYEQLLSNPTMQDGKALFHNTHSNLTSGAGSALTLAALAELRSKMRKQKDLDGNGLLNITPAYLIVPTALEQTAYALTSNNYVPAKPEDINEFRSGGRTALEPVVEPLLDEINPLAWYLSARSSQIDTVEYAFVEGNEGLRVETFASEETDGIRIRATLDFAAKAIDWRGLQRADGA